MTSPITRLIDASVVCLRCGAQGLWSCDCYGFCNRHGCEWIHYKDEPCHRP